MLELLRAAIHRHLNKKIICQHFHNQIKISNFGTLRISLYFSVKEIINTGQVKLGKIIKEYIFQSIRNCTHITVVTFFSQFWIRNLLFRHGDNLSACRDIVN